ncbi:MAG: hypothetical protein M3Y39_16125 [Chloroflexota bacterium]|nr:hypothetical protein [Chloroflexota bacterium]
MQKSRMPKQWQAHSLFSLSTKCSALLLFVALSILVVACGSSSGTAKLGDPMATVTIQIGNNNGSPTPALPGNWCGAWATNTTPPYNAGRVAVYAKFTQNVNGNPVGIGGATATAQVMWTPSYVETYTATTTSDGLAIFPISTANKAFAINTITLVTVTFQKAGIADCTIDQSRAAFFTLIPAKAKATKTPTPQQTGAPNGPPPQTPIATTTPITFPTTTQGTPTVPTFPTQKPFG